MMKSNLRYNSRSVRININNEEVFGMDRKPSPMLINKYKLAEMPEKKNIIYNELNSRHNKETIAKNQHTINTIHNTSVLIPEGKGYGQSPVNYLHSNISPIHTQKQQVKNKVKALSIPHKASQLNRSTISSFYRMKEEN
jgi:hypothetical protein